MKFIYNKLDICNSGGKIFQIMMLKQLAIHLEITNLDPYFTLNLHKIQMEKSFKNIWRNKFFEKVLCGEEAFLCEMQHSETKGLWKIWVNKKLKLLYGKKT